MNDPETQKAEPWDIGKLAAGSQQVGMVTPGLALSTESALVNLQDNEYAFVEMNSASHGVIHPENRGCIYTSSLSGCTGIAAVAPVENGSLVGVSHFDAVVDAQQRTNGQCASELFVHRFTKIANFLGSRSVRFLVAFDRMHTKEAQYVNYSDEAAYEEWHFLRQLECLANETEEDVDIVLQPYSAHEGARTLVAGINNSGQLDTELI